MESPMKFAVSRDGCDWDEFEDEAAAIEHAMGGNDAVVFEVIATVERPGALKRYSGPPPQRMGDGDQKTYYAVSNDQYDWDEFEDEASAIDYAAAHYPAVVYKAIATVALRPVLTWLGGPMPDPIPDEKPWYPDDSGEWVEWAGGPCPVVYGAFVVILLRSYRENRDASMITPRNAVLCKWRHDGAGDDIVAYRVVG